MASVRFRAANAVLRNLTRLNINSNVCLTIHRDNHILSGSLICSVKRTLPEITSLGNANLFRLTYRLEHASTIPTENVSAEKIVSSPTAVNSSVLPKSDAVQGVKADASSSGATKINSPLDESLLPEIPEPPVVTAFIDEPALSTMGMGGWTPPGMVQQILETMHIAFDMPWWACIVSLTVALKVLLLPLNIRAKRSLTEYQNNMPHFMKLQNDLTAARKCGDYYEAARASQECSRYMQEKSLPLLGALAPLFIQTPIFISFYLALTRMASLPEFTSFHNGGVLWFTDLSVPDQFYILPFLTSATIFAMLKWGGTMEAVPSQISNFSAPKLMELIRYVIPPVIFLLIHNFPAGVLCYWTASNLFAVVYAFMMNQKSVKKLLKIPNVIPSNPKPKKSLGVMDEFKESYKNMKIMKELEQREYLNAVKFEEIRGQPARRTFKFDPTKAVKAAQSKEK